jgi:hypothetical protein
LDEIFSMKPVFFTESEARSHIGERVEAKSDFPSVPAGTIGKVAGTKKAQSEGWLLRVEWGLPRKASQYFATIVNVSFNLQLQSAPVTDEFSKDEFQRLVAIPHAA